MRKNICALFYILFFVLSGCGVSMEDQKQAIKDILEANGYDVSKVDPANPKALNRFIRTHEGMIRVLNLDSGNIKTIPSSSLKKLPYLRILQLRHTGISQLPPEIGNLKHLEELDLRDNELETLPDEICNLPAIKTIHLTGNKLTSLPDSFGNLVTLNGTLDLENNRLSTLPASLFKLKEIVGLGLRGNPIEELPETFSKWESLQGLDLTRCSLDTLFRNVVLIPNLHTLDLSENRDIVFSHINFAHCNAKVILLSNCELNELPANLFELPEVGSIHLSHNNLKEIPSEIANLKTLKVLWLDYNKLRILPQEIMSIKGLLSRPKDFEAGLYIGNNHLCSIPQVMEKWLDEHATSFSALEYKPGQKEWHASQICR